MQQILSTLALYTSQIFNNTSSTVKFISTITIFGYLLSFSDTAVKVLSVIPGQLLPPQFWIWTAFTFCFIEIHIWEVILDICSVAFCLKLMEPSWDQLKMLTFFAVTNFGVALLSSVYYLLLFAITKNTEILFDIKIHGLTGFLAALSVAITLVMPDLLIFRSPLGKFTNRNIPLSVLFVSIIFWAVHLISGTYCVMFTSGLVTSFIYLRFYQRHLNGVRGTGAENFTFASFFPNVMQPVICLLVNPIYKASLKLNLVKKHEIPFTQFNTNDLRSVSVQNNADQNDMERRKQIALKALNDRWKAMNATDATKMSTPKSFPQQSAGASRHGHSHGPPHAGHQERRVVPKFDINELMKPIPLPAPPSMMSPAISSSPSTLQSPTDSLISLDDSKASTSTN